MQVALRVLQAVNRKEPPSPADLEELRRVVPNNAGAAVDELACDAIKYALKNRWKPSSEGHPERHLKPGA